MTDQLLDKRNHDFFIIDNEVITQYAAKVGPYSITVYCYLAQRSNAAGKSWPSYKRMADDLGIARSSVVKAVNTLVDHGLLRKESRITTHDDGSVESESNVYILTPRSARVSPDDTPSPPDGTPPVRETDHPSPPDGHKQDPVNKTQLNKTETSVSSVASRRDKSQRKPRKRNETWDAVAAVCGEPDAETEASDFGKTVKELRAIDATIAEIADFPRWWSQTFRGAPLTHRCYRMHFGKYRNSRDKPPDINTIRDPFMRALIRQGVSSNGRGTDDTHSQARGIDRQPAEAQSLGSGVRPDGRDLREDACAM